MKKSLMTWVGSLLLVALAGTAQAQEGGYKVVVNSANQQASLAAADLQAIYMGRKQAWDSGSAITVVAVPDDNAAMTSFVKTVLGKSIPQYQAYWREKLFSGKAVPPRTFKTSEEAMAFVVANPGAVAVVEESADASGAVVVTVQ